jgi:FtsP/CotA-like multicopper oxidase with cupredoxin domain
MFPIPTPIVPLPASLRRAAAHAAAAAALSAAAGLALAGAGAGGPQPLQEMPVLASEHGVLDLLMVARPSAVPSLQPLVPTAALVYEICRRPADGSETCPVPPGGEPLYYGGTRLQLMQGDQLKVHLVNKLPMLGDATHAVDPGQDFLPLNPTNLHTHGLLVAPRYPTKTDPTYGDNVFVLTLNPDNGTPPADAEYHADARWGSTDYQIRIPTTHPSGLYWFHPHVHGISSNQVSSGLSGVITVGKPSDYVCKGTHCASFIDSLPVRHMLLKDLQVLADGSIHSETDPAFCYQQTWQPRPPQGGCDGINQYAGGRHYYTINGQQFPSIDVDTSKGEIWRLTNASSNIIYNLGLFGAAAKSNIVVQVLSIDGVAVSPRKGSTPEQMMAAGGAKFTAVPCPGVTGVPTPTSSAGTTGAAGEPLCVRRLMMFPSSRVELWVSYRDAAGNLAAPPKGGDSATLRTTGHETGEVDGQWTTIDLAQVNFVAPSAKAAATAPAAPRMLDVAPDAQVLKDPTRIAAALRGYNVSVGAEPHCQALAPGHARRIFLGTAGETRAFGMGYEEIDENGAVVPHTTQEVTPFNPDRPTICVPLGAGNTPVHERWEVINIADEDHSLHIHQVRFSILEKDKVTRQYVPRDGILHDSIPLKHVKAGDCESVAAWHEGHCITTTQVIDVPFAVAGDFVYHCHILEHEDGGMMSRIRVRPTP